MASNDDRNVPPGQPGPPRSQNPFVPDDAPERQFIDNPFLLEEQPDLLDTGKVPSFGGAPAESTSIPDEAETPQSVHDLVKDGVVLHRKDRVLSPLEEGAEPRRYGLMVDNIRNKLANAGMPTDILDTMWKPFGTMPGQFVSPETFNVVASAADEMVRDNPRAIIEFNEHLRSVYPDGYDITSEELLNRYGYSPIRSYLLSQNIEELSQRSNVAKGLRKVRDTFSTMGTQTVLALQQPAILGTDVLDYGIRLTEWFRVASAAALSTRQDETRSETYWRLKRKALPPVRVRNLRTGEEEEYFSRVHARFANTVDRVWNGIEWAGAKGLSELMDVISYDGGEQFFRKAAEHAGQRSVDAARINSQVTAAEIPISYPLEILEDANDPALVAGFMLGPWTMVGRHMSKEERESVIAKVRTENSTWPVWALYQDERYKGVMANTDITMMTALGLGLEVGWDPVWGADFAVSAVRGGRAVSRIMFPDEAAHVSRQAGRNTNHIEDIAQSVGDQRYSLYRAEQEANAELASLNRVTPETMERVNKAHVNLSGEMEQLNRKAGAVADDATYTMRQEVMIAEDRAAWYIDNGSELPGTVYDELMKARRALADQAANAGALPVDREVLERTSPKAMHARLRMKLEGDYQTQIRPDPDMVDLLPQDMQTPRVPRPLTQEHRRYMDEVAAPEDDIVMSFPDRETVQPTPGLSREATEDAHVVLKRLNRRNPDYVPDLKKKVAETREFAFEDVGLDLELRNEYNVFLGEVLQDSGQFRSLSPEAQSKINEINEIVNRTLNPKGKAGKFTRMSMEDRIARRRRLASKAWQNTLREDGKTAERLLNELILDHRDELLPVIRNYNPRSPLLTARPVRPNTQGAYKLARETPQVTETQAARFEFDPIGYSQEAAVDFVDEYFANSSAYPMEVLQKQLGSYAKRFQANLGKAKKLSEDLADLARQRMDLKARLADAETDQARKSVQKQLNTVQDKISKTRTKYEKASETAVVGALKNNPEGFRSVFRGNMPNEAVDVAVYDGRLGPIGLGDEPIIPRVGEEAPPPPSPFGPAEEATAGRPRNQHSYFHELKVTRARPAEELAAEKAAVQNRELSRKQPFPIKLEVDEHGPFHPSTMQRELQGQDDMEQGGDMLYHLSRVGGEAVEDIAIHMPNPLLSWDAKEITTTYDWTLVDDVTRVEAELGIARRRGSQLEMYLPDTAESATRSLAREQERVAKAYGAARRLKLPQEEIDALESQYTSIKKATQEMAGKMKNKAERDRFVRAAEKDFDETWLPPQPASMKKAGKVEGFIREMPYYFSKALVPDSYHLSTRYKFYAISQMARSPLRFFETHDPAMAENIRMSYSRFERDLTSDGETIRRIMERGKIASPDVNGSLRANAARSRQLYDLLDTEQGSMKWKRLAEDADPDMLRAHDEIRRMLNHFADEQGLTGKSRYIEGYIRHVTDPDTFDGSTRALEFQGMDDNSFVFVSHLLERTSDEMANAAKDDIVSILDYYIRAKNRKAYLEPLFDDIKISSEMLAGKYGDAMYRKYGSTLVHALQGKPSALTQFGLGRGSRADQGLQAITTALWMATIPFNPRYGLMQMLSALTTTAARVGTGRTMRGMLSMFTKEGQGVARELGFYGTVNTLMENNKLSGYADSLAKASGITEIEAFVRGVSAHAAMDMMLTKYGFDTWQQAVAGRAHHRILFEAMRMAENANHMYGPLARTPYLTAYLGQGISSSMTQFQLFTVKQSEELYSIASQNPGKLVRYFALSGWLARLFTQQAGYDVTQWTGAGYMEQALTGVESPAVGILSDMMDATASVNAQDPQEIEATFQKLLRAMETGIPAIIRSAAKSSERLEEGVARDSRGRKIRDMMHGENTNITQSLLEQFARGIQPERFGEDAQGLGGDIIPTLTLGPGIQDRMHRQSLNAVKRENRQMIYSMRKDLDKLLDAMDDGNTEKAGEMARAYAAQYGINMIMSPDAQRTIVNRAMADNLSKDLRYFINNPKYIPFAVDVFRRTMNQQRQ